MSTHSANSSTPCTQWTIKIVVKRLKTSNPSKARVTGGAPIHHAMRTAIASMSNAVWMLLPTVYFMVCWTESSTASEMGAKSQFEKEERGCADEGG
jgi:hypothetical protein